MSEESGVIAEGSACDQCSHLFDNHDIIAFEPMEGGAILCPEPDCVCVSSWGPGTVVPPYETVVEVVRVYARDNNWSEDRLADALAGFERNRKRA